MVSFPAPSRPFVKHDNTATFEIFVRPAVVPVFRPPQALPIPPLPDPEQGKAVITGSSGQAIVLTKSEQSSWSRSQPIEMERKVTVQRIYQKKPDGTIERENYVDVETATQIKMREGSGETTTYYYAPVEPAPNVEILEDGKVKKNGTISPAVDDDERLPNIG